MSDDPEVRASVRPVTAVLMVVVTVLIAGCSGGGAEVRSGRRDSVTSLSTVTESTIESSGTSTSTADASDSGTTVPTEAPASADDSVEPPTPTSPDACPGPTIVGVGASGQVITVLVGSNAATTATLQTWERVDSCWRSVLGPVVAHVGYSGTSTDKYEGDGATPVGVFGLSAQILGVGPPIPVHGSYRQVQCGDWWDADPSSTTYNSLVSVDCGSSPTFGGGSETLWEETFLYRHFAVIEYNLAPIVPGRGSAIFLHVSNGGPTAGCVSLDGGLLDQVLSWLDPLDQPRIAIGTASQIGWNGQS